MLSYNDLLNMHNSLTLEARALLELKNKAYSKDVKVDALSNLKLVEALGCCTTEQGILARMCDKVSRLSTLTNNNTKGRENVENDESIRDTILDLINYAVLLEAALKERRGDGFSTENYYRYGGCCENKHAGFSNFYDELDTELHRDLHNISNQLNNSPPNKPKGKFRYIFNPKPYNPSPGI